MSDKMKTEIVDAAGVALVTIAPDGNVTIYNDASLNDAARIFWAAVQQEIRGSAPQNPTEAELRCYECGGGWATITSGEKAGEKVPHCDPWCSLQGAGRGGDWKHGDAR